MLLPTNRFVVVILHMNQAAEIVARIGVTCAEAVEHIARAFRRLDWEAIRERELGAEAYLELGDRACWRLLWEPEPEFLAETEAVS